MPRVIEKTIYQFHELPTERAKERARDWYRSCDTWGWADDWLASAVAFGHIASIEIRSADYDRADVTYNFTLDSDGSWWWPQQRSEISGVRAWKWLLNNGWFDRAAEEVQGKCSLTGYCGDADLFDPIHNYRDRPMDVPDLEQVFSECLQSWVQAARRDMEYSYSDEAVDESIECSEYEFDEDGRIQ